MTETIEMDSLSDFTRILEIKIVQTKDERHREHLLGIYRQFMEERSKYN